MVELSACVNGLVVGQDDNFFCNRSRVHTTKKVAYKKTSQSSVLKQIPHSKFCGVALKESSGLNSSVLENI